MASLPLLLAENIIYLLRNLLALSRPRVRRRACAGALFFALPKAAEAAKKIKHFSSINIRREMSVALSLFG
ncbi:hypothetical protein [Planococcus sp. YIM B11945]|uniref:hypothetical protein n=1 Tax=Planococcus sp. YIM B11945 TaxID=3435410 RepID=UPI003D7E6B07